MSMCKCAECDKIYDTDFQMEVNKEGKCICDNCAEKLRDWDNPKLEANGYDNNGNPIRYGIH